MSWFQVRGFIATIRSTPPRRPSQPFSVTRTSYQVGRPWILDGKMLRGLTGTPILRMDRANNSLAEAEPEPLTLANLITKSLTASIRFTFMPPPPSRQTKYPDRHVGVRRHSPWSHPQALGLGLLFPGSCRRLRTLSLIHISEPT